MFKLGFDDDDSNYDYFPEEDNRKKRFRIVNDTDPSSSVIMRDVTKWVQNSNFEQSSIPDFNEQDVIQEKNENIDPSKAERFPSLSVCLNMINQNSVQIWRVQPEATRLITPLDGSISQTSSIYNSYTNYGTIPNTPFHRPRRLLPMTPIAFQENGQLDEERNNESSSSFSCTYENLFFDSDNRNSFSSEVNMEQNHWFSSSCLSSRTPTPTYPKYIYAQKLDSDSYENQRVGYHNIDIWSNNARHCGNSIISENEPYFTSENIKNIQTYSSAMREMLFHHTVKNTIVDEENHGEKVEETEDKKSITTKSTDSHSDVETISANPSFETNLTENTSLYEAYARGIARRFGRYFWDVNETNDCKSRSAGDSFHGRYFGNVSYAVLEMATENRIKGLPQVPNTLWADSKQQVRWVVGNQQPRNHENGLKLEKDSGEHPSQTDSETRGTTLANTGDTAEPSNVDQGSTSDESVISYTNEYWTTPRRHVARYNHLF